MNELDMNWEEEAEIINNYADIKINLTKQAVIEYIIMIVEINGEEYLFLNEMILWEIIKNNEVQENE